MLILFSHFLHMRTNTIISQLTNENNMIKIKYNELYQQYKELEEKLKDLESRLGHIESMPSPHPSPSPHPHPMPGPHPSPMPEPHPMPHPFPSPPSPHPHRNIEPINYTTIIETLESKILELNKQIIQQNKSSIGN